MDLRAPRVCGAVCLGALLVLLCDPAPAQETSSLLVRGGRLLPVEGPVVDKGAVLIREGRVVAAGAGLEAPSGARVLEFPDAVIFPGLVDGGCQTGLYAHRDDPTRPLLPDHRMVDALDPFHPRLQEALAAGITTLHLLPGEENVVGGRSTVVKVGPSGRARILREEGGYGVSLVQRHLASDRAPTSSAGAFELLLRPARGPDPLAALREPGSHVFISVERDLEIELALRLPREAGIKGVLLSGAGVGDHADAVGKAHRGVLLLPLLPAMNPAELRAASGLHAAGVRLGFASAAPARPHRALRLSAVLARRAGLPVEAARRALTLDAARLLGVGDRVGSLVPGKDGDLIVLSHDPTDPRARILLVVVDGEVAWTESGGGG